MKKKILSCAALAAVLAFLLVPFTFTVVAEETTDYTETEVYRFVKDFTEKFASRSAGSDKEKAAAEYIKREFAYMDGFSESDVALQYLNKDLYGTDTLNVVAKLDVQDITEQIIIGAHFDSVASSEGAGDNAVGIAALMYTAKELGARKDELPCDVIFVAFGGEEEGCVGSFAYINSMSSTEIDATLLMINFDSVANGDNLYLHCENKRTDVEDLFTRSAKGKPSKLFVKPYGKGTIPITAGIYETIQNSDHSNFNDIGIPTAFFFSGNYDTAVWGYVESADKNFCVMNTGADTFANLDRRKGEWVSKTVTAAETAVDAVLSKDFMTVTANARAQLVNKGLWYVLWWPKIIVAVLIIVLGALAYTYYRKLEKTSIMGAPEIKTKTVFTNPDSDDIFTFKDKK